MPPSRSFIFNGFLLFLLIGGLFLGVGTLFGESAPEKADKPVRFDKQIAPIFQAKCNRCHGEKSRRGGLDMRTPGSLLKGGASGPAYKPGNSEKSLLVELIHFKEMPPKKVEPRVTPEEFDLIKAWIDAEKPVQEPERGEIQPVQPR